MSLYGILLFLVGALVSAIVSVLFGPFIEQVTSRVLGGAIPGGDSDLRGEWESTYYYISDGQQKAAQQLMRLTQIGRTVYGKSIQGAVAVSSGERISHKHTVRLRVEGEYITGEWRNIWPKARHYGVLQLRIAASGSVMQGEFLGFDSQAKIRHGLWTWHRKEK